MALEEEVATYRRELPRLLSEGKAGQYALIKGASVIGVWPTYGDGVKAGYDRFGLEAEFAVKRIDPRDVDNFPRLEKAAEPTSQTESTAAEWRHRKREEVMALKEEIATYRRELPRLLQEGQAGRWTLLKGASVLGVWATVDEALEEGYERFGLDEKFAVKLIDARDVDRFAQLDTAEGQTSLSEAAALKWRRQKREEVMALKEEIATYRRELPRLLDEGQAGRYALIKGPSIVGIWPTFDEALETGRDRFGLVPIAVKLIDPRDVDKFARLDAAKEAPCPS